MIGINYPKFTMWTVKKCLHDTLGTTLENPKKYFSNIDDTEEVAFMYVAENQIHILLCTNIVPRTERLLSNAKTAPYTADREKKGFYFRGCLPKADTVVEDMIGSTRIPSKKSGADQKSLKKFRNANVNEKLFEKIHQHSMARNPTLISVSSSPRDFKTVYSSSETCPQFKGCGRFFYFICAHSLSEKAWFFVVSWFYQQAYK